MGLVVYFVILVVFSYLIYHYWTHLKLVNTAKSIPIPIIYQQYVFPVVGFLKFFLGLEKDKVQNIVMEEYKKNKQPMVQTINGTYYQIWIL